MTIQANDRRKVYPGNATAVDFEGPQAYDAATIAVYFVDNATFLVTLQTSGYTLTGVGDDNTTVTFAVPPPTTVSVLLLRTVAYEQQVDISNLGPFLPQIIEKAIDLVVQQTQQIADKLVRSIQLRDTYQGPFDPTLPDPVASYALRFKGDKSALEAFDYSGGWAAPGGAGALGFAAYGLNSVARSVQDELVTWVSPQQKGAVGDGIAFDDTAFDRIIADLAALPATRPKILRLYGTYRVSKSIKFNCANLHILSHGATIKADASGAYNHCLTGGPGAQSDSGEFVLFDLMGSASMTIGGGLYLDCASIANLNAFGCSDNQTAGGGAVNVQFLDINNANRGVFTLDNGSGGLIGAQLGTVHLHATNKWPIWLVGNAAADVDFGVVRVNGGVGAGGENVHIEEWGIHIRSLYCGGNAADSPTRTGVRVVSGYACKIDHCYLEYSHQVPFLVESFASLIIDDLRISPSVIITNAGDPVIACQGKGFNCRVNVNRRGYQLPNPLVHIVTDNTHGPFKGAARIRAPYSVADAAADFFSFSGVGPFAGTAQVICQDGDMRYSWDGATMTKHQQGHHGWRTIAFNTNSTQEIGLDKFGGPQPMAVVVLNNTDGSTAHTVTLATAPDPTLVGHVTTLVCEGANVTLANTAGICLLPGGASATLTPGDALSLQALTDGAGNYFWKQVAPMSRVSYGANDSAGAGFKWLRLPNGA